MNREENNTKLERLLQMTDHPERFTDEELQELLSDDDLRNYYELMVTAEEAFSRKHRSHRKQLRIAAVFAGLLLASTLSFAAYHVLTRGERMSQRTVEPVEKVQKATGNHLSDSLSQTGPQQEAPTESVHKIFENTELEQMLGEMAIYYKVRVRYENDEVRHLRLYYEWDSTTPLTDIVSTLDQFEHVSLTLDKETITVR